VSLEGRKRNFPPYLRKAKRGIWVTALLKENETREVFVKFA